MDIHRLLTAKKIYQHFVDNSGGNNVDNVIYSGFKLFWRIQLLGDNINGVAKLFILFKICFDLFRSV